MITKKSEKKYPIKYKEKINSCHGERGQGLMCMTCIGLIPALPGCSAGNLVASDTTGPERGSAN